MNVKTPEQIAIRPLVSIESRLEELNITITTDVEVAIKRGIIAAIEADREQRHHWDGEIYIVQGENGDVLDVFRDADEADAAYGHRYDTAAVSVIAETPWEPGEYAEQRIRTLSREWEEVVNYGRDEDEEPHRASDYALSGDDWRAGLSDDDADEIAALIEWQEGQK